MTSRDLLFVTGTRADFGKLEPLASAAIKAGHRVTFFVTGMHMLLKYGLTKEEVHLKNLYNVVEFINHRDGDTQDIIIAKTIVGFSDYLQENTPDLVIIHGDRAEALACAVVCATNYIRCAHVEGGEVSGTIDEQFRHCNTKLSSIHLVSSKEAKQRVERLGESPDTVHVIGSPELDVHLRPSGVTIDVVRDYYNITAEEFGICIFHPVTSEVATIEKQAASLFEVLTSSGYSFIVILPNNDPGSDKIIKIIEKLPTEQFRVLPSMRFNYFSELMRNAKAIIGNSSIGVREAPFLGVPSLDVGTRQFNRGNASSLVRCSVFDRSSIKCFLDDYWGLRFDRSIKFGNGDSAKLFVDLLEMDSFWKSPTQKYFVE